jgi:hypothetical protein
LRRIWPFTRLPADEDTSAQRPLLLNWRTPELPLPASVGLPAAWVNIERTPLPRSKDQTWEL